MKLLSKEWTLSEGDWGFEYPRGFQNSKYNLY